MHTPVSQSIKQKAKCALDVKNRQKSVSVLNQEKEKKKSDRQGNRTPAPNAAGNVTKHCVTNNLYALLDCTNSAIPPFFFLTIALDVSGHVLIRYICVNGLTCILMNEAN